LSADQGPPPLHLWVWEFKDPTRGWQTIAIGMGGRVMPLVAHKREVLEESDVRSAAINHGVAVNAPVRLARYRLDDVEWKSGQ
jgi:hypothetical protein